MKANVSQFGELTARMRDFRENLLSAQPQVCAERAVVTTETYKANMDQPLAIRRALQYKNILEKMSIFIEDETLFKVTGRYDGKPVDNKYWLLYTLTAPSS